MRVGDKIFVYGTLRPGEVSNQYMKGRATHLGTTRISAEMFDLGWFPGVKVVSEEFNANGPTVEGDLYEIEDPDLPGDLDRYEGYPSLYGRREITTENGVRTFVYEYNGKPGRELLVESGKWESKRGK